MSSVVSNTLPLPTVNGLSRHKSDEWGRRYPPRPCDCCPYGYHIDLDFVRFCETLSQADPAGKQRRRERRRQRKSMEVLLGLNSPPSWSSDRDVPQFLNEPLQERRILESEEEKVYGHSPERDELQKAVLDFEDTLQRSQNSTLKRLSDIPAVGSTFYLPPPELQDIENGNNSSGLSAAALQNIREQMAQSLKRMKELEEQVKEIPVLQIQLSLLKDEKRKLLDKLKISENNKETCIDSVNFNTNSNKYYTFPLKSGLEMKSPYIETVSVPKRPSLRDVSVSCVTMTRDVGVNHTECPVSTRTVGVTCTILPEETRDIKVLNNMDPDIAHNNIILPKEMVSLKSIIKKPSLKDSSTLTDLLFSQLYSDKELDANINKAIKMFEKSYLHKTQKKTRENSLSIGVQVSPSTDTLKIVERSDKGVQAVEKKHTRSYGINCTPEKYDVHVSCHPKTREVGVSEDTLDLSCDHCINKSNTNNDNQSILSLANLSVTRSKSFDYSDRSVLKRPKTRSVACGPVLRVTGTKSCDTSDLIGRSKDVSVNTVKKKLVDTAIGDHVLSNSSFNICDKCSNTIKSVATNILSQSRGEHNSSATMVSRIPRPTTLGHQLHSNQDKPHLTRQDTYTKTFDFTTSQNSQLSRLKDNTFSKSYNLRGNRDSLDDGSDDGNADEPTINNDHSLFDSPLFQPIHNESRKKCEPSKEMRAAMKVLNDALLKSPSGSLPPQMKTAINIVQQEWFKISSTASANPLDVEDYLDCLEEMSSRLLEYVVNMTDISGNTAMHYAVSHGNFDVVSILLDSKVCNINQTNAAGYTCIMLVSLAQVRCETHRQVIKRLFEQADVNIRAKQHGQTALMLAVSHGRLDMVQLLLETGADVNIQDEDGSTALMCAAEHHHIDIVKLLLAQPDCDLSIRDYDGSTALNIAMEAGNRDIGVLLYAQEHFSRGSSPHTSLRHKRAKSTTPTLRTPTSPQPHTKRDHSF